jgi:hypothetical protein
MVRTRFRSPWWLAAAALSGITLAFYHGLWLPGLVLIKRDAFRSFLPLKQYMIERLSAGELPQWFPYEALGRPFIGAASTGVFHPFTLLYFLFPVPDAYRLSTLLSVLLAAIGAFSLGRLLRFTCAGALVAGIAFALSGYVVSLTDNIQYLYSICALPLFCAALEKALIAPRAWAVAPALVWATVFLNGDVQTGYYFGFIALLWAVARGPRPRREAVLRLALVGGLAALLAGVQLGPAAATYVGSERAQPGLFHDEALRWSSHPLRLLTVLASPVGENANPADLGNFFFGSPPIAGGIAGLWAESLYLGVPVTGLAILGAWHRRDLRVLGVLGVFALLLALGRYGGLYELFYRVVPLWSVFRYPEKLMGVVSFAAAMLAGAGFDALRAGKGRATPWLVTAVLCAGVWAGLRTEAAAAWTATSFEAPASLAHEVTESAAWAFLFSAGAALAAGVIATGIRRGWLRAELLLAFLIATITLDLSRVTFAAYHTGPAEVATFVPPLAEALRAREGALRPGRFRLVSFRDSTYIVPKSILGLLGLDAEAVERRQALDQEHNALFHIESADRYLPGHSTALAAMFERKLGLEAAARYNVTYFVGRRHLLKDPRFAESLVAVLPDYDLALFHNPIPAKPRAYLSRKPERAASPLDPVALIARPDFLSGEVDVIETPEPTQPGPAADGSVEMERYAPEEVRVRVQTPQPAVLILLDAHAPGWRAMLEDGREVPIRKANALARAVVVPAGNHVVAFQYETPLLRAGAGATLAGCLLCLTLTLHGRRRKMGSDSIFGRT